MENASGLDLLLFRFLEETCFLEDWCWEEDVITEDGDVRQIVVEGSCCWLS
jgi:hypothetical protein